MVPNSLVYHLLMFHSFRVLELRGRIPGKHTNTKYLVQVGVANDGKLNGIDMNLYADCGSSPNDLDVGYAQTWVDNGKQYFIIYILTHTH